MPSTDHHVRISGTGKGDSVSISGRSDDPVQAILRIDGGSAVQANVGATIHGDGQNPVAGTISGPDGKAVEINVGAAISGGTPVTVAIEGGARPVSAAVTAAITEPIRLDVGLGDVGLRNTTIRFKLFGLFTLLSIEVGT